MNLKTQTWIRDSYGLYDYEMRNPMKCSFKFDYSRNLVRIGTTAYLEPEELDINEKYKGQGQLLGRIDKKRNSFVIVSAQQVKWQTATEEEREELMKEDCENCYKKDGEQALPPI